MGKSLLFTSSGSSWHPGPLAAAGRPPPHPVQTAAQRCRSAAARRHAPWLPAAHLHENVTDRVGFTAASASLPKPAVGPILQHPFSRRTCRLTSEECMRRGYGNLRQLPLSAFCSAATAARFSARALAAARFAAAASRSCWRCCAAPALPAAMDTCAHGGGMP